MHVRKKCARVVPPWSWPPWSWSSQPPSPPYGAARNSNGHRIPRSKVQQGRGFKSSRARERGSQGSKRPRLQGSRVQLSRVQASKASRVQGFRYNYSARKKSGPRSKGPGVQWIRGSQGSWRPRLQESKGPGLKGPSVQASKAPDMGRTLILAQKKPTT